MPVRTQYKVPNDYCMISKKNAIKILLKIKKANLITQEVEEEKWISESFIDGKDYEILSFEFKSRF